MEVDGIALIDSDWGVDCIWMGVGMHSVGV
jgi:hypothetical protein